MSQRFEKILYMSAVRSSAYLSVTTAVRALNGLAVLKVLALCTGPAEFGRLSQVMGVVALCGMLAAGGIGSGLTRQMAASQDAAGAQRWLCVALKVYLVASATLASLLLASSWSLASWLVGDVAYTIVFVCLAAGQALVGASTLAQSIATARGDYAFILRISVIGAVLGAGLVTAAIFSGGALAGAIALVANAALPGLVAIVIKHASVLRFIRGPRDAAPYADVVQLLQYAVVALLGAASLTISQIATRNLLGQALGWDSVGIWQTVVRTSDVYMQFISVLLMGYVLPRLSGYVGFRAMHPSFVRMGGTLCSLFLAMASCIYLLRDLVIQSLFSSAFLDATNLMLPQLLGDLFRIIAVCFSVALMARGQPKPSMVYEASQGILAFALTALLLDTSGPSAPVHAYCATYAVLMIPLALAYRAGLRSERTT